MVLEYGFHLLVKPEYSIRLLFSGLTVIHQRHAEVKILRFLSGQLAVGIVWFHFSFTPE